MFPRRWARDGVGINPLKEMVIVELDTEARVDLPLRRSQLLVSQFTSSPPLFPKLATSLLETSY